MKVGDIVWLKSGGVAMTVLEVGGGLNSDKVTCGYFTNDEAFKEVVVPIGALTDTPKNGQREPSTTASHADGRSPQTETKLS